jgi:hypothetical protein
MQPNAVTCQVQKTEDEIIKHFETELLATTPGQCLHYGIKHKTTKSKKNQSTISVTDIFMAVTLLYSQ